MDLRHLFSIVFRRYIVILAVVFVFLISGFLVTWKFAPSSSGALLFISLGVERMEVDNENYNPREAVEAADRFADTVQGWIRNPDLMIRMQQRADVPLNVSARKQEKQNLAVDVKTNYGIDVQPVAEAVLVVLREEINSYNQSTNSGFRIATSSVNFYENKPSYKFNLLFALLAGMFAGIFIVYLDEFLRGVVTFPFQAEKILGTKGFSDIKKTDVNEQNTSLIGSYLNGLENKILVASVGMNAKDLIVPLVKEMAKHGVGRVALLDFDLKNRDLHKVAELGDDKLLGITDISAKTFSSISDYFRIIGENVQFLSAGQGNNFDIELVDWVAKVVSKVVIYSTLPENPAVLGLPVTDLVLLIKPGSTKEKDLEQIKMIFKGKVHILFVN